MAVDQAGLLSIVHATLRIEAFPGADIEDWSYSCGDLRAGALRRPIDRDGLDVLLKQVTGGKFEFSGQQFVLVGEGDGLPTFYFPAHIDTSPANGIFANHMRVTGTNRSSVLLNPSKVDLLLKAQALPFQSLQELHTHVGIQTQASDRVQLDVIATAVAEVHQADAESHVDGDKARVTVMLSSALNPGELRLGWRALVDGVVKDRSSISGEKVTWEVEGLLQSAHFEFEVAQRSVVECFVSFREQIQHAWWVGDPRIIYNSRRVVHEAFDPKLEKLEELLFDPAYLKKESRKFEEGVTYLLSMLGFRATRYDNPLADAPDIIVSTAAGDIALIECSTAAFDPGKLTKLKARAALVRAKLDASAHHARRVVALAVTSLSRAEIEADLQTATRMGIVVIAAENLRAGLPRTLYQADPHLQIYEEAIAELAVQGQLPLE